MTFSIDEWFVVCLARMIRDREVVFHGFASPCAQVAMHVAKRTHAREMLLVEGAMYALDPEPSFIPPTSNDAVLGAGSVYSMRFEEFFDAGARGDVDRMFLSGGQIDRWGNTNVTAIGLRGQADEPRPKVKLGGGGGGCNLSATVRHTTLWTTRHRSGRTLVEACDFITDIGHRTPRGTREELSHPGGGPDRLVTELGIFDFDEEGHARLRSLFPDVTLEEVREATGFPLRTVTDPRPPRPPGHSELAALRDIDPLAVRRQEFSSRESARVFTMGDGACGACL